MSKGKWVILTIAMGITLATPWITAQAPAPTRPRAPTVRINQGTTTDGTTFEGSPHVGALRLVFQTQGAVIDRVDEGEWWLDTDVRNWIVRRVADPGISDTRHDFFVV